MSIESFMKMLRPRIEARTPFLAYWHPNGVMVLNTDRTMILEYDVFIRAYGKVEKKHAKTALQRYAIVRDARASGKSIDRTQEVEKYVKTKARSVNKMRKIIEQLKKDPRISQVYVIEFDGTNLIGKWPDPDVLSSLNVEVIP